jgi:putative PIN family toxin of toxin-antitoxin system
MRVVLDTNVLVSALRSSLGASHALLTAIPSPKFQTALSIPLYMEYQAVLSRPGLLPDSFSREDVRAVFCYLAAHSHHQDIYFLWRPFLPDPKDDMVLELAVASRSSFIITHNLADFRAAPAFGVHAMTPSDFLHHLGETP